MTAPNSLGDVQLRVNAQTRSAESQLQGFAGTVRAIFTGLVAREIAQFTAAIVRAGAEADRSQRRLTAVVRATGQAAGLTVRQLEEIAQKIQDTTLFDDEAARDAISVLATFRSVQGQTFREGISLTTDLAEAMGTDLRSAALQLGKALNDPVLGVTALSRAGVQFTDVQKAMIQQFVDTGRLVEAQQVILAELKGEMAGVAAGASGGLAGAVKQVTDNWDDFKEALGNTEPFRNALTNIANFLRAFTPLTDAQRKAVRLADLDAIEARNTPLFGFSPQEFADFQASARTEAVKLRAEISASFGDLATLRLAEEAEAVRAAKAAADRLEGERLGALAAADAAETRKNAEAQRIIDLDRAADRTQAIEAIIERAERVITARRAASQDAIQQGIDRVQLLTRRAVVAITEDQDSAAAAAKRAAEASARAWESAAGRIASALTDVVFRAGSLFERLRTAVLAIAESITQAFLQRGIIKLLRKLGVDAVAQIPARAAGGPVFPGQPVLVGERGPELFVSRSGGTIVPSGTAAAGMAPVTIQQQFTIQTGLPVQVVAQTRAIAMRAATEAVQVLLDRMQGRR